MPTATSAAEAPPAPVGLDVVVREWGRIGCLGFGGPPAHIALFRDLCVTRRRWIDDEAFEDALAVCNLLPGPASTQMSILCAYRVAGRRGAIVGGLCFILPGLVAILALSVAFLGGDPPTWLRGAGAGAGAAVAAVAVHAGWGLLGPSWARAGGRRVRFVTYALVGGCAAAFLGAWVVVALLACGAAEVAIRRPALASLLPAGPFVAAALGASGAFGLAWTAFKVGALSYGGGFVIIPLMQHDAVDRHGWMTDAQFLDAVALGQVTPGPVVHTVAAVGYAAGGVGAGLLAAAVAFAPSFAFILVGGPRIGDLRRNRGVAAFVDGAGPAALGAILGSAVPLAAAIGELWQAAVLGVAAVALLVLRRGVVPTLLAAGMAGALLAAAGAPLP